MWACCRQLHTRGSQPSPWLLLTRRSGRQQEEDAARALVTVNKTIAHMETNKPVPKRAVEQAELHQARTTSPASLLAGELDKFGRRIMTPPLTRTNSSSSMPGTPRRELDARVSLHDPVLG